MSNNEKDPEMDKLFDEGEAQEVKHEEKKEAKTYEIKWKSKIARAMKIINVGLDKLYEETFTGDEVSIISEEWEDVCTDVLKRGPLALKVGIAVIMTFAVIFSYAIRVHNKLKRKKDEKSTGETGPTPSNTG